MGDKKSEAVGSRKPHVAVEGAWEEYLARLRRVISEAKKKRLFGLDGKQFSPLRYDPAELESLLNQSHAVCEQLFDIVDKIHWPKDRYGSDGCRSDESAVELTIRYLREPDGPHSQGIEGAWELAYQAARRYCEWKSNPRYASLGVNLGAYFAAELDAILHLIEQDHVRRAAGPAEATRNGPGVRGNPVDEVRA